MSLRVRNARAADFKTIERMLIGYGFHTTIEHIQSLVVAESDDGEIVAVGVLAAILESIFMTDKRTPKRDRLEALEILTSLADKYASSLGYDSYHGFVEDSKVEKTLIKHFSFEHAKGTNLIRWVKT